MGLVKFVEPMRKNPFFFCRKPITLSMDDVHLTSVFMKFEKEGQFYEIPLCGNKVNLDQNKSRMSFKPKEHTLSVTGHDTQIELNFELTKEDHEVK